MPETKFSSVPCQSPTPASLSLEQVAQAFSDWRASGRTRRTPSQLQRQAASLLDQHSVSTVIKALGLDRKRLKVWRQALLSNEPAVSPSPDFHDVPAANRQMTPMPLGTLDSSGLSLTLTRQSADGSAVSISGHLEAAGWRWALKLLREDER